MAENADVQFSIRADSSQLETDLNTAVNRVYHAAEQSEAAADSIGQSAERTAGTTTEAINTTTEAGKKAGEKLTAAFGKIGKAAAAATAAVAGVSAAIGTAAVKSADDLDKAVKRVTTATGAGAEAADKYAEVISNVYGDNFGENFDDIAASVSTITQNLGELDEQQLTNVTESAYALQDAFDMDVAETSRAAKAMAENFGISAEKAYDYIAKGAQDGLNYSGELLDNISEYSVQFKKLGFSADDMFTIFAQGAENGAWNLDKIGDAVKEFSIRAIDGSDTTKKGFEALGFDAEDVAAKFAEGGETARAAFKTVVDALGEMDDPIKQNEAGVNLFGTMWEDLGVDAVRALGDISNSAYDCAGAMDEIKEVNYSSLSDALGGLQRQVELLIQPLGDSLIPVISDVIDGLSGMADEVIPELLDAITPVLENLTPLIEPLLELVSSVLPQLVELITPVIEVLSGLIQTILPPLTELIGESLLPMFMELAEWFEESMFPIIEQLIGWLTESFVPVLEEVLNELMPPMMEILEALTPLLQTLLDILLPILDMVLQLIDPILQLISEALAPMISELLMLINDILTPLMPLIQQIVVFLKNTLSNGLTYITSMLGNVFTYFKNIFHNIREMLGGLIDFITGVFTGNWEKAWQGVQKIFSGIWNNIKSVAELVVNGILDIVNGFISGINNVFGWLGVKIEPLKHVDFTADDAKEQATQAVESYNGTQTAGDWRNAEYARQAGYTADGTKYNSASWQNTEYAEKANAVTAASSAPTIEPMAFKSYTPTGDSKTTKGSSSSGSGKNSTVVSVTSYVPTMWDSDQTAALKSLIGRDVLGKTTTAHQINDLTGVLSSGRESTSASTETNLADVINAITRLQRKVERIESAFGNMTIALTADDLTIGKACVRDCNAMAKRSGKSPFNF